jgi:hypothetical protein
MRARVCVYSARISRSIPHDSMWWCNFNSLHLITRMLILQRKIPHELMTYRCDTVAILSRYQSSSLRIIHETHIRIYIWFGNYSYYHCVHITYMTIRCFASVSLIIIITMRSCNVNLIITLYVLGHATYSSIDFYGSFELENTCNALSG